MISVEMEDVLAVMLWVFLLPSIRQVRWTFFSILCHICCILCQKRHEIITML